MHTQDAHENEYLAAAAAIHEQTPRTTPTHDYAIGDYVTFRLRGWSDRSYDDGRVMGHHNGKVLVETDSDVFEVDPRDWPAGEMLPF